MTKIEKSFQAAITAATEGAKINAATNPLLVPTIFLINEEGRIQLVDWADDHRPWERIDYIREELVKRYGAVAIVYVAEIDVNSPQGKLDGVMVYGYLSGRKPRAVARTFLLDTNRRLRPFRMTLPDRFTDWVKQALSET